jgi:hypothetical protein
MSTAAIVTLVCVGLVVALILVFLPRLTGALGWGNATAALDKVAAALHSAFTSVEAKVFLSYFGRSKILDLLVWFEKVIQLLPEGDQKTKAVQARNDLIDAFKSAPVYPANAQPVVPPQPPIS